MFFLLGTELMHKHRAKKRKETSPKLKYHQLCNGPSKLCQAFQIDKSFNLVDMTSSKVFYSHDGGEDATRKIVACKRIGIDGYGEPAASQSYRFYLKGNKNVSTRDKTAENSSLNT